MLDWDLVYESWSGTSTAWRGRQARRGPLAAVVLRMVEGAELFAIVISALQISPAAGVAVVTAAVTRTVTVALPLPTRLLGRAAPPAVVVATRAALARRRPGAVRAAETAGQAGDQQRHQPLHQHNGEQLAGTENCVTVRGIAA